jgi:hypothetical protein
MKIRTGFVSNSSSASFIVKWCSTEKPSKRQLKKDLKKLFEYYGWHSESEDPIIKEIFNKTNIQKNDTCYTTTFWTSMLNNYGDLGMDAAMFYFILSMNKGDGFEIISANVEDDY